MLGKRKTDTDAGTENHVKEFVMHKIEGKVGDLKCVGGGYPFGNLADLTDGKLAKAKPDRFYCVWHLPLSTNRQICQRLSDPIIPSRSRQQALDRAGQRCSEEYTALSREIEGRLALVTPSRSLRRPKMRRPFKP